MLTFTSLPHLLAIPYHTWVCHYIPSVLLMSHFQTFRSLLPTLNFLSRLIAILHYSRLCYALHSALLLSLLLSLISLSLLLLMYHSIHGYALPFTTYWGFFSEAARQPMLWVFVRTPAWRSDYLGSIPPRTQLALIYSEHTLGVCRMSPGIVS